MAAWTTAARVEVLLRRELHDDEHIDGLIDLAQGLAENEIGEHAEPGRRLVAVFTAIVARMWQASKDAEINPAASESETAGPFTRSSSHAGAAGLGLTNREIAALHTAVGQSGLSVMSTTRGPVETGPIVDGRQDRYVTPDQLIPVDGGPADGYNAPMLYVDPGDPA